MMLIARSILIRSTAAAMLAGAVAGCAVATSPDHQQSDSTRQDQALADPMNYQLTPPSVSNNGDSIDRQGLSRDLNDVLNP